MTIQQKIFYSILTVFTLSFWFATFTYHWHFKISLAESERKRAEQVNSHIVIDLEELLSSHMELAMTLNNDGDVSSVYDELPWLSFMGRQFVKKNFRSIFERYPYLRKVEFYKHDELLVAVASNATQQNDNTSITQSTTLNFTNARVVLLTDVVAFVQKHLMRNNADKQTCLNYVNQDGSWLIGRDSLLPYSSASNKKLAGEVEIFEHPYIASSLEKRSEWSIQSLISQAKVQAELNGVLFGAMLSYFVVILIIFFIARHFSRLITHSLEKLESAAQKLMEGDFSPISHDQKDETTPAILAFNSMSERILGFTQELQDKIDQRTKELLNTRDQLQTVFDSVDAMVYVVEIETHEIISSNKYIRDRFGNVEGKKCWQVLQKDQSGPCEFCRLDEIPPSDDSAMAFVWEIQNSVTGRWYECRDKIVRWLDDRMVRLQIATDITDRKHAQEKLLQEKKKLEKALIKIKQLSGLLPICASCKKIRDDKGYWNQIESYITLHSEAEFSHGICPECAKKLYPEFVDKDGNIK